MNLNIDYLYKALDGGITMLRPLEKTDDLTRVAELIYHTNNRLFPFLFGKEEKAIPKIRALIERDDNVFSHKYIWVEFKDELRAILIEIDVDDQPSNKKDFEAVFKKTERFKLWLKGLLTFSIFHKPVRQGRYIQNICVCKSQRGRGIGSKMMNDAILRAKMKHRSHVSLDVSIRNKAAIDLYQMLGFKIIKKRRAWGFINKTYLMEKEL